MLVLIDESGDTGFKEGSSRYFVMTMIVFNGCDKHGRYLSAEKAATTILQVKSEVNHKPEFHFSKCHHKVRQSFFRGLNANHCQFKVYSLVVDKKKIYSAHLKKKNKDFYNFVLKQLLKNNPIRDAKVKIDGSKGRAFKKALKSYLRQGQSGMINKLSFVNSESDSLIQLADMCCSAIAYSFKHQGDRLDADIYKNLIGKRIVNIWEFE